LKPEASIILIDTREQQPLKFSPGKIPDASAS
jgi:hypothetical protein